MRVMTRIWAHVERLGLNYLRPRTFNQDALENLFGAIRTSCGNNDNPTVPQFVSSLKTQIVSGLTNRGFSGANCEEDDARILSDLRTLVFPSTEKDTTRNEDNETRLAQNITKNPYNSSNIASDIENMVFSGKVEALSVAYVGGFIIKRLMSEIQSCTTCQSDLTSDSSSPWNLFISFKEFSDDKSKLIYPSEKLVVSVGVGITAIENALKIHRSGDIKKKGMQLIGENVDFSFLTCLSHSDLIKESVSEGLVRIGVKWYCTRTVRDLKEKRKTSQRRSSRKLGILQHH